EVRRTTSRTELRLRAGRSCSGNRDTLTQDMRRILLLLAGAAIFALPAAAAARSHSHHPAPGFLVVHNASTDGGVAGRPVATVVVQGFVLGRIAQEGAVQIYHL